MSHLTERKEKDCLNCGAALHGRFCQVCGQENIEPKESFWHLLTHFVYDVTHFDGKFFSTLKYLLFRPGFLSHEYLRGRRASYLHPIRMYVFTSALFFLIFFSTNKDNDVAKVQDSTRTAAQQMKRLEKRQKTLLQSIAKLDSSMSPVDSGVSSFAKKPIEKKLLLVDSDIARLRRDTFYKKDIKSLGNESDFNNLLSMQADTVFKSVAAYDSVQLKLPKDKRDGFIARRFMRQKLHLNEKYKGDGKAIMQAVLDKFTHLFPQMLFVSLPLFALMMQLLYVRKKKFFYVNHVVFTIHLYCGTFIIILTAMFITWLFWLMGITGGWDEFALTLATLFFWYKSMRNFYEQRRAKTILKYILMMFLSMIMMILIFVVFFIFSAMAI